MKLLRALAASFSYFSILPTRTFDNVPDADAIGFLPIVGIAIGALAGWCGYGAYVITHQSLAAAIAAWIAGIALSGAIHVDGFLDCCDGLFAMETPERRLQIMRDPHHGTYAIVGMATLTLLWVYALTQIPPKEFVEAVIVAAVISRLSVQALAGASMARVWAIAVAVAIVSFVRLSWSAFALVLGAPTLVTLAIASFAKWRLSGARSGDVFGAVIVVTEVAVLLSAPYVLPLR